MATPSFISGDAFGGPGTGGGPPDSWRIELTIPNIPLTVPAEAITQLSALVVKTVRLALQYAAGQISREAPVDSGHLAQSFGADPATATGGIELIGVQPGVEISGRVFSSLPYAIVMELGRRPGSPISRAGINAIGLWAQRKLGLSPEEANRAKWAIAMNIINQGFEGTGYFTKGVEAARPKIEDMFQILGEEIAKALTDEKGPG